MTNRKLSQSDIPVEMFRSSIQALGSFDFKTVSSSLVNSFFFECHSQFQYCADNLNAFMNALHESRTARKETRGFIAISIMELTRMADST